MLAEVQEKGLRETKIHLAKMNQQLINLWGHMQERHDQLRVVTQQMKIIRGQLEEKDAETANLQNQATALRQQKEEKDQEIDELEITLSIAQDELRDHQRQDSPDWVISRDHIQLIRTFLLVEGKYCGGSVAVKQIHELILSCHNRKLFEREMDIVQDAATLACCSSLKLQMTKGIHCL